MKSASSKARGKAFAKKNPDHFNEWRGDREVNRHTYHKYGVALVKLGLLSPVKKKVKQPRLPLPVVSAVMAPKVYTPTTRSIKKEGSKAMAIHRPSVDLTMACSATGMVKLRCGCVRCGNARKSNGRVR